MKQIFPILAIFIAVFSCVAQTTASEFDQPWKQKHRALVIDAYEYNPIDWAELVTNKRIVGFINKASDGVSPLYAGNCTGGDHERKVCQVLWKRFAVTKELYHTRRQLAKAMGLKWGAYHLGRPGNPIEQADHFVDFADPQPDEIMAIDIEGNDPQKWMSLAEAEVFSQRIYQKLGRYPMLYTNGSTADFIAANRDDYKLLSRLPLWYARYKPSIGSHFPEGHWQSYDLWQFAANVNCKRATRCPYRTAGTPWNIDINVSPLTPDALRAAWPMDQLVEPMGEVIFANNDDTDLPIARLEAPLAAEIVPLPSKRPKKRHWKTDLTFVEAIDLVTDEGIRFAINRQVSLHLNPSRTMPRLSHAGMFTLPPQIDPIQTASVPKKPTAEWPILAFFNTAPIISGTLFSYGP